MSSIVKAKALGYMSKNPDYYKARIETISHSGERVEVSIDSHASALDGYLDEANEKRNNIIDQAIKQSKQMNTEAQMQAESLIESSKKASRKIFIDAENEGYTKGYNQGLIDGSKAAEKSAQEGLTEIESLVHLMKKEKPLQSFPKGFRLD